MIQSHNPETPEELERLESLDKDWPEEEWRREVGQETEVRDREIELLTEGKAALKDWPDDNQ
jgi:hypothetical protein